jgi:internalin A
MTDEELLGVIEQAARDRSTYLDLSYKNLTSIPRVIGELICLQELKLNGNQLTTIPADIGKLKNLRRLELRDNNLVRLPREFGTLKLTSLTFGNNPWQNLPPEIRRGNVKSILNFYRQQLEQDTDWIYEAKILILGEGGAGKTSLAKKILSSNYHLKEEDSTQGIDITEWRFPIENGKEFRVNIWDFGGQEIYHSTHQFFLTKRSLYMLVVDTRKGDTDFYYWLNSIKLLSDNSPLLIVKNEKQDRKLEINERQLRGEFTNLKETISTNLSSNRGLSQILTDIKHYITNLSHIGTELPKTWIKVREELEKDPRNFISLDEYLECCEKNGFTKAKDKLQLSSYLHDLGVFLHFQEDNLLSKTVILKPTWGTDAVYKVLDNVEIINNHGEFTDYDLKNIWHENKYFNMQPELLRLMMNFKICYEIPGSVGHYIAPQLLSSLQPEYEWNEHNNLLLRYEYEFMPKGIFTRFIVEMHNLIEEQASVWKNGVILSEDDTRAEVIELYRYHKGEIRIRIVGKYKRKLLANIRHEFDKIHGFYNAFDNQNLKYETLISCNCRVCKFSQSPYFYPLGTLHNFLENKVNSIQCSMSHEMINVRSLIDNLFLEAKQVKIDYESIPLSTMKSIDDAESFLLQIDEQGFEVTNEVKVLIVGEPDAGKTSLKKKLIDPNYTIPNNEDSTLGIQVHMGWSFICKEKAIFSANIWDFGGQQIQYALHHFFLSTNSLYILVANDRQQRTDFDYWFNIIKLLGKGSPVLIVFNEYGNTSITNFDISSYTKRYSELKIERRDVDLSLDDGRIESLSKKIKEMISSLEYFVRKKLPVGWLLVRKELEKIINKNYIGINQYFELCQKHGIKREKDQLLLSGYLHDLGIILHFQDDSSLSQFVVLNPQWVVDAIYTILSKIKMRNCSGRFTQRILFDLWREQGYLFEERNYLLNLMKKDNFDLCYKLFSYDGEDEYIIPQLLQDIRPSYEWDSNDNLRFCFQYPFLPKGIISQLIVRLSNYILRVNDKDLVWRYGAVLTRNDHSKQQVIGEVKAEIIEEINRDSQKVIGIRVMGPNREKKAFLTIIIKEVLDIHKRFGEIKWEERIPCNCSVCKIGQEPYLYDFHRELKRRLNQKIYEIECGESFEKVKIINLIDDVIDEDGSELFDLTKEYTNKLRREAIEKELSIRCEKLLNLRKACGSSANTAIKFQLEKEIDAEEKEIDKLNIKLSDLY